MPNTSSLGNNLFHHCSKSAKRAPRCRFRRFIADPRDNPSPGCHCSTGAGDIVRMVGGLKSEWWARSDQNAGRLQIGIGGRLASEFAQISPNHAKIIAETGGSIGIWHFFPSLDKYVEGTKEMVDVVGVEHVSIGTDQQLAPGSLQDYAQWVQLVAALLRGGFTPEEVGNIVGGNYMRIFHAAVG
jgi:hypothetical protein